MNQLVTALRAEARDAPESGIVEVINYGRERPGLIPLWAGEGDLPTPQFICDAATRSLAAGETFYTYQRGVPELRQALADYHKTHFGRDLPAERFFVTGSGMQAMQIAVHAIAGAGDEVIIPEPAWPNIAAAAEINGARGVRLPMRMGNNGWYLDLDQLADTITEKTRAIFINTPGNPTGWVADEEFLRQVLDLARKRGLWIIADEVYARFYYGDAKRAPSFYDIAEEDDQILYINTLSKNWAMTGWRVGWLSAPPVLGQVIENLIQYSTSGVAAFMQRAATTAIEQGEEFVEHQIAIARRGREIVCNALSATDRANIIWPEGAFYLFFSVDGEPDTNKLGLKLVDEANVGLAPGTAFGEAGQGYLRLCYARSADSLQEAADRLVTWLNR